MGRYHACGNPSRIAVDLYGNAMKIDPHTGQKFGPFPPEIFPLDLSALPNMDGKFLQVCLWLFSEDKESTPVVKEIQAQFNTDG